MAILFPNTPATHQRQTGYDMYGQPQWSAPVAIRIGVVRLSAGMQKTSVRADSSASRGRAEEDVADGVVLITPDVQIGNGDRLVIEGTSYEVISVFPRRDIPGVLRHFEVNLRLAGAGAS